jgi:uridylate kinase
MNGKKRILLKLTGGALLGSDGKGTGGLDTINAIAQQIKELAKTHQFGVVIGGGNFFRGCVQGKQLGITPVVGHHIGMLATLMNGLILQDVFERNGLPSTLLTAFTCPIVGATVCQQEIDRAHAENRIIIFAGGTGVPFVTTDTNAVIRACQMGAQEVWKATGVEGVYEADPRITPNAKLLKNLTYAQAITKELKIVDTAALGIGLENKLIIRVFSIFEKNALLQAAEEPLFGSTIK